MKKIENLWLDKGIPKTAALDKCPFKLKDKNRLNIIALGDVGMTVLIGLRLLGADAVSSIGILDLSEDNMNRLEMEINQIRYPFSIKELPPVDIISEDELFDCDVVVFCASRGVPPIGHKGDVRMAQLEANRNIIAHYGELAKEKEYKGMIAVVSDPVDPLCRAFKDAAQLQPYQIQGYGLGVMNARASYYAEKDLRFAHYREEGAAFGPHGADLVIADSIKNYNHELSCELTALAVNANMKVRDLGYKPYIAPALSSAAISIILTLQGEYHYSSIYLGDKNEGAFLGIRNVMTDKGIIYEDFDLDEELYARIKKAYDNLVAIR